MLLSTLVLGSGVSDRDITSDTNHKLYIYILKNFDQMKSEQDFDSFLHSVVLSCSEEFRADEIKIVHNIFNNSNSSFIAARRVQKAFNCS